LRRVTFRQPSERFRGGWQTEGLGEVTGAPAGIALCLAKYDDLMLLADQLLHERDDPVLARALAVHRAHDGLDDRLLTAIGVDVAKSAIGQKEPLVERNRPFGTA
jgi:hypothetical protein